MAGGGGPPAKGEIIMSRNDPQQGRSRDDQMRGDQKGQARGQTGQGARMRDEQQRGSAMPEGRPAGTQLEDEEMDIPERGDVKQGKKPTGMQDKRGNQPR